MGIGQSCRSDLHFAIQQGQEKEVKTLIRSGIGPNVKFQACSPLYRAISSEQEDIALFLLTCRRSNVKIGKHPDTLLVCACRKGMCKIVKRLLEHGVNVNKRGLNGHTPLWTAVAESRADIVRLLLSQDKIKINQCCKDNFFPKTEVPYLLRNDTIQHENDCSSPLDKAVRTQDEEIVHLLCHHGADVNKPDNRGRIPLHHACYSGSISITALLIFYKSDINAVDRFNETPLYTATVSCHKEIVKMLIRAGCNLNIQKSTKDLSKLFSPLHAAVDLSYTQIVELLASRPECNLNLLDRYYRTPLMIACIKSSCVDEINSLLKYGASTCYTNEFGSNALILALHQQNFIAVKRLLKEDDIDVNTSDRSQSALCYAISCGSMDVLKWIIARGANIQRPNNRGCTPLFISAWRSFLNETSLLIHHGANLPSDNSLIQDLVLKILMQRKYDYEILFLLATHCQLVRNVINNMLKCEITSNSSFIRLCSKVLENLGTPFSLKKLCKHCIRTVLASTVETSVLVPIQSLPIPVKLKEFLSD